MPPTFQKNALTFKNWALFADDTGAGSDAGTSPYGCPEIRIFCLLLQLFRTKTPFLCLQIKITRIFSNSVKGGRIVQRVPVE